MALISNYPLNSTWGQETTNKIAFNQIEFQQGILYKGAIVSNQLNGISHILSQILQYQQCSGGMYQPTMTYHKGNFVSVMTKGYTTPLQVETYQCIFDNNGAGIVNKPPIKDSVETTTNNVTTYTNGIPNTTYWKRVDIGNDNTIEPQEHTFSGQYITELCRLPEITYKNGDEFAKEIKADVWVTTYLGNKACAVNLKLNGRYILNKDKNKYIQPRDYFNMPVPNVSIGEVVFFDGVETSNSYTPSQKLSYYSALTNQTINENNLYTGAICPYGFNIWVGYTLMNNGTKLWALYLVFKEANKVTLNGTSNIGLSIKNTTQESNITIQNVIPVRPNGGATNNYEDLLTLREYDFHTSGASEIMLHYSRGEIPLNSAKTLTASKSMYMILARLQGVVNPTLKEHSGRHTRCYGGGIWAGDSQPYAKSSAGQLIEPGLPNIKGEIDLYLYYPYEFIGDLYFIKDDANNPLWKDSSHSTSRGYTARIYDSGKSYNTQRFTHNRFNMNAKYVSSIYKDNYNDISPKSISIARYIKAF